MDDSSNHILVVDDEEGIRELLRETLEQNGYRCHTSCDGKGALETLASQPVELALLDMMMPGMTGLSLFQHLKEEYPSTAVIFLTAVDDLSLAVEHLKGGAYDYLVKPVTRKRLRQAVEDALARRLEELKEREERRRLEEQVAEKALALEWKVRELTALNHMIQVDLSRRFAADSFGPVDSEPSPEDRLQRSISALRESVRTGNAHYPHKQIQGRLMALENRLLRCRDLVPTDPGRVASLLEGIKEELRGIQQNDMNGQKDELFPQVVRKGLVPSLNCLRDRFGATVPVDLDIAPEIERGELTNELSFPEDVTVGVYRIVEESLDNVVKHAGAKSASVRVSFQEGGNLAIEVTDGGRGFDGGKAPHLFGLLRIRDYAGALGGTCKVDSTKGQGTRIRVAVPFQPLTR